RAVGLCPVDEEGTYWGQRKQDHESPDGFMCYTTYPEMARPHSATAMALGEMLDVFTMFSSLVCSADRTCAVNPDVSV
ncbi:hypothetical protein, partial [Corynebacterium glucuronolyticum]|uniref:hypothetical protein n=1 Tax=Corynebacterium glucuronolyticum TaxID=39791 RepID=UPI00223B9C5F